MPITSPGFISPRVIVDFLHVVSLQNVLVVGWVITASIVAIAVGSMI